MHSFVVTDEGFVVAVVVVTVVTTVYGFLDAESGLDGTDDSFLEIGCLQSTFSKSIKIAKSSFRFSVKLVQKDYI